MKTNIGSIDRIIRVMLAIAVVALYAANVISGTVAIVLLTLAGIFILTSVVSFCPVYFLFGLSTLRKRTHASH